MNRLGRDILVEVGILVDRGIPVEVGTLEVDALDLHKCRSHNTHQYCSRCNSSHCCQGTGQVRQEWGSGATLKP